MSCRSFHYFTGKALEDDDDFEDEDDEDADEPEFDEVSLLVIPITSCPDACAAQDSESDDGDVPARRRAPPKGRGTAAGNSSNVNPEECKQ
ncbi:hypothetical protein GGX14DRAFT_597211 [Mycena pura]|uniref:Uncharacterized protein n=1 Tax=Mycena pura TaxID=153505 RepID=A0AAD6XZ93_9AGAR|nr:hypothetical protein GGX14DRAFT_597211 [Mycena pura]